jgi:lipoprotein-anchoring transpeptidase ErfK/SrfK
VRYRPKTWWQPGTTVKVLADINGLAAGDGVYGQRNVSTEFTVSKKTVLTKVNLKTHKAKVYVNDKLARTIPISAGKPGFATRSGTKLIMDKRPLVRMTGVSIGIKEGSSEDFDLNVRYAMRITASGEYIHAAPWNSGLLGRQNGSHGCVGMSTANAIWLYNLVRSGDPVVTTGSTKKIEQGNGYSDWDVSWEQYRKGSAI